MKKSTKKDLLKQIKTMQLLGDDLVAAIRDAAWTWADGRPNLHGPTFHMHDAVDKWKEATRV